MTSIGITFLVLALGSILIWRANAVPSLLIITGIFYQAPALVVLGNPVPLWYVAIIITAPYIVRFLWLQGHIFAWGETMLLVLIVVLSATILPIVFSGTAVLVPDEGIDYQAQMPGRLALSLSNLGQTGYFLLSVICVLYIAAVNHYQLQIALRRGFIIGGVVNAWALSSYMWGIWYPETFFLPDTSTLRYGTDAIEGRFQGVYAEPSNLSVFLIASMIYFAVALMTNNPEPKYKHRWIVDICFLGLSTLSWTVSMSGTGLVASILFVAFLLFYFATWLLREHGFRIQPRNALIILLVGTALALIGADLITYMVSLVEDKLATSSFAHRTTADNLSLQIILSTFGLGVGWGSTRPSSFFWSIMSSLGIVGGVIYWHWIYRFATCSAFSRSGQAAFLPFVGVLLAKLVAEPNLTNPIMICLMGACVALAPSKCLDEESTNGHLSRIFIRNAVRKGNHDINRMQIA